MATAPMPHRAFWLTSQVARRLGLSSESVRLLERKGRLRATRTETGTRLFDPDDVEREAQRRERERQATASHDNKETNELTA